MSATAGRYPHHTTPLTPYLGSQLDGFDARGNIKVLMATNRPDTLDPALLRPGRLDRKVEVRRGEERRGQLGGGVWWVREFCHQHFAFRKYI